MITEHIYAKISKRYLYAPNKRRGVRLVLSSFERSLTAKNGVKIYSYKNPNLHGFYISLFLKGGSMYEEQGDEGITHFLEHVLVRNVNKLFSGRLYSELDRLGIEFNASTYAEMVQFYVCGADKNFCRGAEIISKLLCPIALTREEIDTERRRIKAEIRENDDKNSMSAFAMQTVYPGTTLKNYITGTAKSVSKITRSRLEKYRRDVFTGENVFLYVTGSFTEEDILDLSEKIGAATLFGAVPKRDNVAPVPQNFLKRDANVALKNDDFTMVRFNFDIDMSRVSSPVIDVIYDNLFSGYNSPFFIKMSEERGIFYDISGAVERYKNIGMLYFSFEVREAAIYDAVSMSVEILNSFMSAPLEEGALMKAGYVDNAQMLYDDLRESNFTLAYDSHILDLGYPSLASRRAVYEKITAEDVRRGACEIFSPKNLTLTVKGKKKKIDTERIREILLTLGKKLTR